MLRTTRLGAMLLVLSTVLPTLLLSTLAHAEQGFPSKLVKLILPTPPGANLDTIGRLLAVKLQKKWSQPVIVENRPGAAGNIGTEAVYRAPADGYTLLFAPQQALVVSKLMNPKVTFDPEELVPVSVVSRSTVLMLANPQVPAADVTQLIAYAKANPGKLNFATTGFGSTAQLSNDLFGYLSKTQNVNIPFQGIAPATTALLGGQVDILFDSMANAMANVKAGTLKVLAVGSHERNPALPQVPSVSEVLPSFTTTLWSGFAAPPKTPNSIVQKISTDIAEALKDPDFATLVANTNGMELIGSTPAEMDSLLKEERKQWAEVIRLTGAKAD